MRFDSVLLKTDGSAYAMSGWASDRRESRFAFASACNVGRWIWWRPSCRASAGHSDRCFGLTRVMRSLLELGDNWSIIRDSNQALVDDEPRAVVRSVRATGDDWWS